MSLEISFNNQNLRLQSFKDDVGLVKPKNIDYMQIGVWIIIFLLGFGPGQLTSFMLSLVIKLDFISQPPSKSKGLEHMQQCHVGWNIPIFFCSTLLIQMNGAWKMVSSAGGLNPRHLSHESSALTTRLRLLALIQCC